MAKSFTVVGAGLGGLAVALRLAHRGHRVTLFEKTDLVGGRNRPVRVGECDFDGGPTLMMMLDPFEKLFRDVGERIEDHLDLCLCDPSYRVFYADGTQLDGSPNAARMIKQIKAMSGERDAAGAMRLLGDLAELYRDAIPNFVRRNFRTPLDFFGPKQLALVARHRMIANLGKRIDHYVEDPRLRMLFSFQTMYLGLSPFDAPWVYSVLTYMEYGEGIWYPMGGMTRICETVADLARARGVDIRLGEPVRRIDGGAVELESGVRHAADAVVCNADLPYAETALMGEPARTKRRYSCSAYMMYIDYEGSLPELLHHNVFFGRDFRGNLEDIFRHHRLPDDPAFYACVSARTDPAKAPAGRENLYVLVPCPNLDRPFTSEDEKQIQAHVFGRLCQSSGFDPAGIRAMKTFTPGDWNTVLNLDRGAAFGLSHDFWQSAYFRPGNRSRRNPKTYFVGASTVPGNGLPMVLISAELAEERVLREV